MLLPELYHWSPSERRDKIRKEGLQPFSIPVLSTSGDDPDLYPDGPVAWPYLCFSPDPKTAWKYSGDMEWVSEIEEWDLWQVKLADNDEVRYRSEWGPYIVEVRVYGTIPTDRLWLVATRSCPVAEPINKKVKKLAKK